MSVINQMLRDLDKRQARPATLAGPALQNTSSTRRWLWWLLLLPVLWFGAQWLSKNGTAVTPAASPVPATQPAAEATTPVTAEVTTATSPAALQATEIVAVKPEVPAQAQVVPAAPAVQKTDTQQAVTPAPVVEITAPAVATMTEAESDSADAFALSAETEAFLQDAETLPAPEPVKKAQMSVTRTDPAQDGPQQLRALAMQAQAAGRFAEAETAWLQLSRQQPQQTESYEALAQLYLQQQQPQRLASLLQQAQQQQLQSPALQWAQIQLLASTAQWQALLGALTSELQQQYPQQALALEAHAAQQLGQTDRALQVYQRWTERSPQDSRAWLGLATSLDQSGQWPKAQQAYQQALQLGGLTDASRQFIQQRLQQNTQS